MIVELVGMTQPLIPGLTTANDLISYAARVSNPDNQLNIQTADGLLRYCLRHHHYSVFETVNVVFSIETTRDIGRQILRHRSLSFQEFSQRYAEASNVMIPRETRIQDTENKQNSLDADPSSDAAVYFYNAQRDVWEEAIDAYTSALAIGVAKEQARALLPEGLTTTNMFANGTLRSWIHYCQVRCGVETQKEHRLIAKEIAKILMLHFPFLQSQSWLDNDYSAET